MPANDPRPVTGNDVLITRLIAAPRTLVFAAWTDPAHLARWFAPRGCTIAFARLDLRSGGSFHSCIRTPDGHECWCIGTYREIIAPERLVFTMAIADAQGRLIDPASVGMDPAWPRETVVTVTFAERAGGTTGLTLHQTVDEALAKRTGAHPSWLQMLDRLAEELAATRG
jgi:uncharacterized protein YndB with AHSA1/START domain